jgi:hypothetical protein
MRELHSVTECLILDDNICFSFDDAANEVYNYIGLKSLRNHCAERKSNYLFVKIGSSKVVYTDYCPPFKIIQNMEC